MIDVRTSSVFDSLIKDLSGDWRVDFKDLDTGMRYDLDLDQSIIILPTFGLNPDQSLSSPYFRPQILAGLIESLRMVRHVEWLEGSLTPYHPETILLIGRVCVADTMAHLIHIAHQMKCDQDDNSVWKHMLCGDLSDMAQAYAVSLDGYIDSGMVIEQAEKKAMAATFNTWFSNQDRIKSCDHDTLNLIDNMIVEETAFQGKKLEKNAITCLTLLSGDDTSYLDQSLHNDILKNPYYKSLNDPINQAHFMQITVDMNSYRVGGLIFQDQSLANRFSV